MAKIYTKGGDKGETSLFDGKRVGKDDPLVETYGTVDVLNSTIGVVRSVHGGDGKLGALLHQLQNELMLLGADLGSGKPVAERITEGHVTAWEQIIDELTAEMPPLVSFILPGGHIVAAHLHQARTFCRRAERLAVYASREREIDPVILKYLNRLADALFVLARYANYVAGVEDEIWQP